MTVSNVKLFKWKTFIKVYVLYIYSQLLTFYEDLIEVKKVKVTSVLLDFPKVFVNKISNRFPFKLFVGIIF